MPTPLTHVWDYTDRDLALWREELADWLPPVLWDAHLHVFRAADRRHPMTEARRRQYWVNELVEPCDAAATARCHATVYPGRTVRAVVFGYPDHDWDLEASNAYLGAGAAPRGWVTNVLLDPRWSGERLEAELDRPGVLGVKPYYTLLGHTPDSRDTFLEASIFDFLPHHHLAILDRRRRWVTLHVPKARRLGHPDNLREIREIRQRYPGVVLVVAHFGRCYALGHAREALPALAGEAGLYFDNSAVLNPAVHRLALECFGPERVLWGSDNPLFYVRGRETFTERGYAIHTAHPFAFNRHREPPEVEAGYTLLLYEQLRAIRQAGRDLGYGPAEVRALFHDNTDRLVRGILPDAPAPAAP